MYAVIALLLSVVCVRLFIVLLANEICGHIVCWNYY